jgi:uncharacterized RDD family membrane protein YckC
VAEEPSSAPAPAGFWLRAGAYSLDGAALALTGSLLLFPVPEPARSVARLLLAAAYFSLLPPFWGGRTLGKAAAGLAIARTDGEPLGAGRSLLRWLGYFVSMLPFGLGFFAAAFTRERRALHDFIAGTRVVQAEAIGAGRRAAVIGVGVVLPLLAALGLAALLALPRLTELRAQADEGAVKERLAVLRASAAAAFARDGVYPLDPLDAAPAEDAAAVAGPGLALHPNAKGVEVYGAEVCSGSTAPGSEIVGGALRDTGRWGYVSDPKASCYGKIFVDCTHADTRGRPWNEN